MKIGTYYLFAVDHLGHLRIAPQTGEVEHRSLLFGKQAFAVGEAVFGEDGDVSLNDECSTWQPGEARAQRLAAAARLFEALGYRVREERLRPYALHESRPHRIVEVNP